MIPAAHQNRMTPGIVAIQHMVPLGVRSSRVSHEYLGKGATVSIRSMNGRIAHHHADVHLRIFPKGKALGWNKVPPLSRTELDHLLGMLFREPGYGGAMLQIRNAFASIRPPSVDLENDDWISMSNRLIEEDRPTTIEEGEVEEQVPPNTPRPEHAEASKPIHPRRQTARKTVPPLPRRVGRVPWERQVDGEDGDEEDDLPAVSSPPTIVLKERPEDTREESEPPKLPALSEGRRTPESLPGLTYVDDDVTPAGKIVEKSSEVDIVGKKYPVPNPADPLTSHAAQSSTAPKTVKQLLSEIMMTLIKMKYEMVVAFDDETRELIGKLERETHQMIATRNAQEDLKREAKRKEARGKGVDRDGDVEMEETDKAEKEEGPTDYQTYLLSPEGVRPVTSYLVDIYTKIRALQGDVTSLKWKKVDDDNTLEGRVDLLEGKVTALDMFRDDEDTSLTTRRRSGPVTRGMTQKLDEKVDSYVRDLQTLRGRIRDLEREQDDSRVSRRRVGEAERRVVSLEGELAKEKAKVSILSAKIDEVIARQELISDQTQAQDSGNSGSPSRVSVLESQVATLSYRLISAEEQLTWANQKIRSVWSLAGAQSPTEGFIHNAHLRSIWVAAHASYQRRAERGPAAAIPLTQPLFGTLTHNPLAGPAGGPSIRPITVPPPAQNDRPPDYQEQRPPRY